MEIYEPMDSSLGKDIANREGERQNYYSDLFQWEQSAALFMMKEVQ